MTFNEIEMAIHREKQIRRLRREIREARENVMPSKIKTITVNGETQYLSGGGHGLPSSPTERWFATLQRLELKLTEAEHEQDRFWEQVELIDDDEIRSIIYWRVDMLKTWDTVARLVNGPGSSRTTPLMRLKRWTETN